MSETKPRLNAACLVASLGSAALTILPTASMASTVTVSILSPPSLSTLGTSPDSPLLTDAQGNFYGSLELSATSSNFWGSLFSLAPDGSVADLHSFDNTQGYPEGPMVRTSDGTIYGVTYDGGAYESGSIFSLAADGTFSVLYNFSSSGIGNRDGSAPMGLTLGSDGALYGSTHAGGAGNAGTLFRITTAGQFSVVYTFSSNLRAGAGPCPLIAGRNGLLYGTTETGNGTVFSLTLGGRLKTLHRFAAGQSGLQCPGITQGSDGNFYGTTFAGRASGVGSGNGTIFKMTSSGNVTFLHSFAPGDPNADGAFPVGLIQATDGNLYGITQIGGANGAGTLFQMTTSGTFTNLYDFPLSLDNQPFGYPIANVIQGSDGALYGTTNGFSIVFGQEIFAPAVFKAVIGP